MRIIAIKALREHWQKPGRADSREPLLSWHAMVEAAEWKGPAEIKDQYRSASFVGNRVVFNICGNKYRMVVYVNYAGRRVYVRFVGTHAEYDRINVKEV
ncbi:MAG: type II toxin-antitoxin system HigB family toxin [Phycisphaerales bacterium]|jgi:mRNA interferase HigB